MTRRDPLLRTASQIVRALDRTDRASDPPQAKLGRDLIALLDEAARLERLSALLSLVRQRGWPAATARVSERARHLLGELRHGVAAALARPSASPPSPPSLGCTIDELRQLSEEFEDVEFEPRRGRVVAWTPPIELEGVRLGPFAIELHLKRLTQRTPDASCFSCVPLRPNPASSNSSVTHPHVQDGQLCAGDATAPVASALREGRLCDAFCLIRSVLLTYNAASPYVSLDEWDGIACEDCGRGTSRDDTCYCEHCERDYCGDCMSYCAACDGSCCRGCLEQDEEAGKDLCPGCRSRCRECGRVVGREDVDDPTGRCPQCREQDDEDHEEESEPQETEQEDSHEPDPDTATDPRQPGIAALADANAPARPA